VSVSYVLIIHAPDSPGYVGVGTYCILMVTSSDGAGIALNPEIEVRCLPKTRGHVISPVTSVLSREHLYSSKKN